MLVTFGKLSVNLRKLSGKTWNARLLHFLAEFSITLHSAQIYSEYFSQAINSLITGWTVCTKNKNPSVLRIDLPAVGLYVRTSGFIFFRIDSPTSY